MNPTPTDIPASPQTQPSPPIPSQSQSSKKIFIIIGIIIFVILTTTTAFFLGKSQNNQKLNPSSPSPALPTTVISSPTLPSSLSPTPTTDPTTSWKTYNSPCKFAVKYPPDWNVQKYFIQDSNDSCSYITAPDYKTGLDTRNGFYISISRTLIGSKSKNITINSLDDYIAMEENISEPPTQVKNKQNQSYGVHHGKQFELGLFELETQFIFIQNHYIYSAAWPANYSGAHKNSLNQILSTFKFTNQ